MADLGARAEDAAADWLRAKGFTLKARNWRCREGEIDIVAEKDGMLVFVEVKARAKGGLSRPHEALTKTKAARLWAAASRYLSDTGLWDRPCRFDAILALEHDGRLTLRHLPDLPVQGPATAGAWQPW